MLVLWFVVLRDYYSNFGFRVCAAQTPNTNVGIDTLSTPGINSNISICICSTPASHPKPEMVVICNVEWMLWFAANSNW